ncbi:hypothetical protein [Microbacterium elymi]|uniref:Uncharacterized protein n=1 Tax=Microbacterium elymi TaxID=2909587 RepID=A0ABY5NKY9_9MICO|nr:hypothetical protein [Microbacterium elymi]UUT35853.1 hypothetical protein L2X98_22025 [Microbacterium elymi]
MGSSVRARALVATLTAALIASMLALVPTAAFADESGSITGHVRARRRRLARRRDRVDLGLRDSGRGGR